SVAPGGRDDRSAPLARSGVAMTKSVYGIAGRRSLTLTLAVAATVAMTATAAATATEAAAAVRRPSVADEAGEEGDEALCDGDGLGRRARDGVAGELGDLQSRDGL